MAWSETILEGLKLINGLFVGPRKQIEKVVKIYDAMNKAVIETSTERFLIMKAHNGGGVITPTGDLYVSVLYEDYTHPFKSTKAEYQKIPTDKVYAKMLLEVIHSRRLIYATETMSEGLMKEIYLKEGVRSAVIYYLGQSRKNIYFCSCASSQDVSWTTNSGQLLTLDLAANIIKQNIR